MQPYLKAYLKPISILNFVATVKFGDGEVSPVGLVKIDLRTLGHRLFSAGPNEEPVPAPGYSDISRRGPARGWGQSRGSEPRHGEKPGQEPE